MCVFKKIKNSWDWLLTIIKYGDVEGNVVDPVTADYYNHSDNELENIFIELTKISEKPICIFNKEFFTERVNFLANEGLHVVYAQNIKPKTTKVSKKDLEKILTKAVKSKVKKKITKKTK